MNLGLFIGRLNPPHIGHIGIIKRALKENNKVLVLLGTPLSKDQNNPFDFKQREALLDLSFKNENNLKILELKDNKSDLIWIENLKEIISSNYREINNINLYCGDFENDSVYIVIKQYEKELKNYNINYILNDRKKSFIEYNDKKYSVSATNLRKFLKNKNYNLAEKFTGKQILEKILKFNIIN